MKVDDKCCEKEGQDEKKKKKTGTRGFVLVDLSVRLPSFKHRDKKDQFASTI